MDEKDYDRIHDLMKASFQEEEIRTYESGLKQLEYTNYRILTVRNKDADIIGFIADWELESFIFLEHFAVDTKYRGAGIGSAMLATYLNQATNTVILEVEDYDTEIEKRRIGFYQRMGFHLSEFGYLQPILRGDTCKEIPLRIMSFSDKLTEQDFNTFKNEVFSKIYKVSN
ncbi:hypothetical protein AKG39_03175 [Acetobacterium bakii]|uniref:N-acetyltransferase domain-containing protein n=1 Tax=Acetobacterium bakii TaxID=52689 RepID=A0A0L6U3V9_9FIRM|nr:hypothetical protein AKG39_03175 [Acetobacterium bakii]